MSAPGRTGRTAGGGREAGFTLVELLVAMGVFAVLMTLALTAVVGMTRVTTRVQNVGDASDRLRQAFLTLDRQARYADAVNFPGASGGAWWVEMHTPATDAAAARCTQWRYTPTTHRLEQRSWADGSLPTAGTWRTVADRMLGDAQPFALVPADATYVHQELRVRLRAGSSDSAAGGRSGLDTRFVARNSTASSPGNADSNGDGVSDAPVCGPLATVRS